MTITLDTDLLKSMAASISGAQQDLAGCVAAMGRIVEHQDWCCPERELINEAISRLRQEVRQLEEDLEQFSAAIHGAAGKFDYMEQSIPGLFQEMDLMLGRLSAVSPGGPDSSGGAADVIARRAAAETAAARGLEAYSAASLTEDIRICRFSDFAPQE